MTEETLKQYEDRLRRHDWFYDYSDDGAVWRRGEASMAELRRLARGVPERETLLDAWIGWKLRGGPQPPPAEDGSITKDGGSQ